jgi:hypothetical protein
LENLFNFTSTNLATHPSHPLTPSTRHLPTQSDTIANMAANYSAYFADLRVRHPKASYPETECSVLTSFLNGDISAQQCATDITKYTDRRSPVNGKLCIWALIVELGRDFAETHDDLVALIKEIRSIPSSKDTGGIDWTKEEQSFNEAFRGIYDSLWSDTEDAKVGARNQTPQQSEISRQWTNINALSAKLQHAGLMDDLANGLRLIVATLEKKTSPVQLEMNLGATAAWLEFAGIDIKEGAAKVGQYTSWAEDSEQNQSGMVDAKRLAAWRDKLNELSSTEGLGSEVSDGCERATSAIEQALWIKTK